MKLEFVPIQRPDGKIIICNEHDELRYDLEHNMWYIAGSFPAYHPTSGTVTNVTAETTSNNQNNPPWYYVTANVAE